MGGLEAAAAELRQRLEAAERRCLSAGPSEVRALLGCHSTTRGCVA